MKLFHVNEDDIILSDCPDLRIPMLNYGIKVSRVLTKEEAITDKKRPLYVSTNMFLFNHSYESFFYGTILINCITSLYVFDYVHQELTSYHYDKNELMKMNNQALIYESTCSKKRKPIIFRGG